jgi:hypothetical protein
MTEVLCLIVPIVPFELTFCAESNTEENIGRVMQREGG